MSGTSWPGGTGGPGNLDGPARGHGVSGQGDSRASTVPEPTPHGPAFLPPDRLPPGYGQRSGSHQYVAGPPRHGTPPQGWQAPPGPGPERPNRTSVFVMGAILLVAVLGLAAWLFWSGGDAVDPGSDEATVAPLDPLDPGPTVSPLEPDPRETPGSQPSRDAGQPDPGETTGQQPAEPQPPPLEPEPPLDTQAPRPPIMPTMVEDYDAMVQPEPELAFYISRDGARMLVAVHYTGYTAQEGASVYAGAQQLGAWYCALVPDTSEALCMADAHGGVVVIGNHPDAVALAGWGDSFLSLWK